VANSPTNALAPWGELVAHEQRMASADLFALPDDGHQYELVEGRLVRMPPGGQEASGLAVMLGAAILAFVQAHHLGWVSGADGAYDLGDDTDLAPDVGFVRAERRLPRTHPLFAKAWPLAPDLAVEVASSNQWRPDMGAKAARYLRAGTRLVWVVWPRWRAVDVWHPGEAEPSRTLGARDVLDGENVLPGFSYPLASLFGYLDE
jgi:Uma2 family endonuclease